jgi:uncharacterized membrane protein YeaQ/YmgE (transglycosylase-associated protein family)
VLLALLVLLVVLFVVLPILGLALWALISTIFVGLIIGALGRLVVPGAQPIGFLATVAAGLCGAIGGGFLGDKVFSVGRFATTLLEIAVSAAMVALLARPARQRYPR